MKKIIYRIEVSSPTKVIAVSKKVQSKKTPWLRAKHIKFGGRDLERTTQFLRNKIGIPKNIAAVNDSGETFGVCAFAELSSVSLV